MTMKTRHARRKYSAGKEWVAGKGIGSFKCSLRKVAKKTPSSRRIPYYLCDPCLRGIFALSTSAYSKSGATSLRKVSSCPSWSKEAKRTMMVPAPASTYWWIRSTA